LGGDGLLEAHGIRRTRPPGLATEIATMPYPGDRSDRLEVLNFLHDSALANANSQQTFQIGPRAVHLRERPKRQGGMSGHALEVAVGAEQLQFPVNAKLGQQGIDGPHLQSQAPALIAKLCRTNVVVSVRNDVGKRAESLDDLLAGSRTGKTLEQFLEYETGCEDELSCPQCLRQSTEMRQIGWRVAPQRQRPYARVDEQTHSRERSVL
jgi:hypothetical protein